MVPVILIAMVLTCLVKEKPLAATTIWGLVPQTLQIDGMANVRLEESTDREDAPTGFDHHWVRDSLWPRTHHVQPWMPTVASPRSVDPHTYESGAGHQVQFCPSAAGSGAPSLAATILTVLPFGIDLPCCADRCGGQYAHS
jgi:hypothetical protein